MPRLSSGPRDHINIRILQTLTSGIPEIVPWSYKVEILVCILYYILCTIYSILYTHYIIPYAILHYTIFLLYHILYYIVLCHTRI